jgi:hypothetical protein
MCGGMPSQVMGPQMDADQLTGLVNHCSGSLVGQRKNALIRANSFLFDVSLEPISNLLRDKNDLGFIATFGIPEDQFSTVNILGDKFEHLTDSHAPTGHKLQHETVSWIRCSENDFVNNLLFQNSPMGNFGRFKQFPEHRGAARIFKFRIDGILDEIKEGCQAGIAGSLG